MNNKIRFETLFPSLTPAGFIHGFLFREPRFDRVPPERFAVISNTWRAGAIADALNARGASSDAQRIFAVRKRATLVSAAAASGLYWNRQKTVGIRDMEKKIPELKLLLEDLARQFGIPEKDSEAHAFLGRKGALTPTHYDPTDNIIIQLRGRKRWVLAPSPLSSSFRGHAVAEKTASDLYRHDVRYPAASGTRWHASFVKKGAVTTEVEAGAVLYVPRAYWHSTYVLEDSLSISMRFSFPSFSDLFLDHRRAALKETPGEAGLEAFAADFKRALADARSTRGHWRL